MAWQHLAPRADANLGGVKAEAGEIWSRVHASIRMQNYSGAMRALRTHIMTHPNDYIAYDLRCLCALHCNDYSLALSDAIQCTTLNPTWSRGWARLGAAQLCLGHPTAAASAYAQGLRLDPKNEEMLTGMELAKKAGHARGGHSRRAAMHDTEDA